MHSMSEESETKALRERECPGRAASASLPRATDDVLRVRELAGRRAPRGRASRRVRILQRRSRPIGGAERIVRPVAPPPGDPTAVLHDRGGSRVRAVASRRRLDSDLPAMPPRSTGVMTVSPRADPADGGTADRWRPALDSGSVRVSNLMQCASQLNDVPAGWGGLHVGRPRAGAASRAPRATRHAPGRSGTDVAALGGPKQAARGRGRHK